MNDSIYRYRANARLVAGGPPNTILGPVACQASFPDGPIIRSRLCWREKGGRVHECQRQRRKRRPDKRGSRWMVGRP